ncbi:MAG: hypothetical protein ACI9VR_000095 [Cognaticolwellia sp.]|jgi:hypothetical protein
MLVCHLKVQATPREASRGNSESFKYPNSLTGTPTGWVSPSIPLRGKTRNSTDAKANVEKEEPRSRKRPRGFSASAVFAWRIGSGGTVKPRWGQSSRAGDSQAALGTVKPRWGQSSRATTVEASSVRQSIQAPYGNRGKLAAQARCGSRVKPDTAVGSSPIRLSGQARYGSRVKPDTAVDPRPLWQSSLAALVEAKISKPAQLDESGGKAKALHRCRS